MVMFVSFRTSIPSVISAQFFRLILNIRGGRDQPRHAARCRWVSYCNEPHGVLLRNGDQTVADVPSLNRDSSNAIQDYWGITER